MSATTTWPTPAPGDISNRAASVFEQAFPPNPATGDLGIDARSPNTIATVITHIVELAMLDLYYDQANIAVELMPDTAVKNLYRFGNIYDVPRDQPQPATGNVIVSGAPNSAVPNEVTFSLGGSNTTYSSTAAAKIGANGTVSLPVVASPAGSAGNLAAGTQLTITSPVEGLTSQTGTVDSNGITNGADLESISSWRARILAQIRLEPSGGTYSDYVKWALAASSNVSIAACPPGACGGGVVSVVIFGPGYTVASAALVAEVQAYINTQRPVTANVTVYAGTLNLVNVTLHLNPDTPTIRAAASTALALSFEQDAAVGSTTYVTRLDNAVSSSDGEYSHEMSTPAADVVAPTLFALNVLGAVNFV
jgi:uncharacterized phage protein gp47/JayE